ncbi:MAG: group 1 glycosyl transferase [Parcubacteria group bacterium Gr01-1014_18]|nr:MAG: group 1 glycosyl transferase [Parcubacteria group bacterium Greene0416_36]TSC81107.1 MAG: group 1 glycosyl transferase [Parcubacteria group bacterium Gr01-1014_18]TSC98477.1 MAG: group 1 glycosyl transferase [Parcubacteria group bacterium Greene1014_20]TSD07358.1 MAG: group 1 glycosyl transferase [Parcubacteria group bacterium Greene0714_2]
MNIGIDIRSVVSGPVAGVGEYTFRIIQAMSAKDQDNEYFLFYNSWASVSVPFVAGRNVHVIGTHYPNKILNQSFRFLSRPKMESLVGTKLDFFWLPNWNFYPRDPSLPYILTVHDLSPFIEPSFFSWKRRLWHRWIGALDLIENASHIVAVSENTKRDIMQICDISAEKISVVYSGVDCEFEETPNEEDLRRVILKYNLPAKFILFLGTIEPRKNVEGLIEAFSRMAVGENRDLHLVIAGGWGWNYGGVLAAHLHSPARDRIHFLGYIKREEKLSLYHLSRSFAFPSFYEGFGFPPLEAAMAGKAIVSSYSSSLGKILPRSAILVDPYDISELSRALIASLGRETSVYERVEITKRFSWERAGREMEEIIKNDELRMTN